MATWGNLSTTYVTRGTSNKCPTWSQIQSGTKSGYNVTCSITRATNQLCRYNTLSWKSSSYSVSVQCLSSQYTYVMANMKITVAGTTYTSGTKSGTGGVEYSVTGVAAGASYTVRVTTCGGRESTTDVWEVADAVHDSSSADEIGTVDTNILVRYDITQ